jgi:hypothetical protein
MSARVIVAPSDPQLAKGESSPLWRQGRGKTPAALLSANLAVDALSGLDDSEKLSDDLRRRFEVVEPLPWWHGGLNE